MFKMKYLMPDVDKHTAGIIYVMMIAAGIVALIFVNIIFPH